MAKQANTTSLDTIITLLRVTMKDRDQIQGDLDKINATIQNLQEQARAALEGTGFSLNIIELKPKVSIANWYDLRTGDVIRVKVDGKRPDTGQDWEVRTVDEIEEKDFDGNLTIRVSEILSDGSTWVHIGQDEWEFISRP